MERKLYKMLSDNKKHLTKQQYLTIKGQIRSGDYQGAYKGIVKIIN